MFSNRTIKEAKENHGLDIDSMQKCDKQIDSQVTDYGDRLKESSDNIENARDNGNRVFNEHHSAGLSQIDKFNDFKDSVHNRGNIVRVFIQVLH